MIHTSTNLDHGVKIARFIAVNESGTLSDQNKIGSRAMARRKRVICLDDGAVYESARAAALKHGWSIASVAAVCKPNGRRKTIYGKRFAYLDEAGGVS